jgi:hypothetical protein
MHDRKIVFIFIINTNKTHIHHICATKTLLNSVISNEFDWYLCSQYNKVKLWFYDHRFYISREFMHFLHGPGQMPITVMLNFNGFCFPNFTFPPNLHFIFLVLTMKNYLILHFVFQFSEFLIQGNRLPSVSSHKWFSLKIHTTKWLMHSCK